MKTSRKNEDKRNYFFELYLNDARIKGEKSDFSLLYILTRRTVIFLLIYLFFTVSFFFVGNFQSFMDSNLILIANVVSLTSVALICFSLAGIIEIFITVLRKSARKSVFSYLINIFLMAFSFAIGIVCLIAFRTIDILSQRM
ncbi:MAG: hypothetical protein HDR51_03970 [Treponema sp.]|nr:hypothetical protein [Treponema sp.]MBD5443329.1 hypothetical protein [Treponema sp.]